MNLSFLPCFGWPYGRYRRPHCIGIQMGRNRVTTAVVPSSSPIPPLILNILNRIGYTYVIMIMYTAIFGIEK